jgi:hypothetical protein
MDMTFHNKAMQEMSGFAIQLNKNSFGLAPANPLNLTLPVRPNSSSEISLALNTLGPVQKMNPLTNLQVAIKNNVDIFYFSCIVPLHVFCTADGMMDKRVFLSTWKEIPAQNEVQHVLDVLSLSADALSAKLKSNHVFTIAKRTVDGQDMLYQSFKLTNGIWVLAELKLQPGNPKATLSIKSRSLDVAPSAQQMYEMIILS